MPSREASLQQKRQKRILFITAIIFVAIVIIITIDMARQTSPPGSKKYGVEKVKETVGESETTEE